MINPGECYWWEGKSDPKVVLFFVYVEGKPMSYSVSDSSVVHEQTEHARTHKLLRYSVSGLSVMNEQTDHARTHVPLSYSVNGLSVMNEQTDHAKKCYKRSSQDRKTHGKLNTQDGQKY